MKLALASVCDASDGWKRQEPVTYSQGPGIFLLKSQVLRAQGMWVKEGGWSHCVY